MAGLDLLAPGDLTDETIERATAGHRRTFFNAIEEEIGESVLVNDLPAIFQKLAAARVAPVTPSEATPTREDEQWAEMRTLRAELEAAQSAAATEPGRELTNAELLERAAEQKHMAAGALMDARPRRAPTGRSYSPMPKRPMRRRVQHRRGRWITRCSGCHSRSCAT